MTQPLKPCPFCGDEDVTTELKRPMPEHLIRYIYCHNPECGAVVSFRGGPASMAIELFNSRAVPTNRA